MIDEYDALLVAVVRKTLFRFPDRQEECFNDVLLNIWQHISVFDEGKSTFKNWTAAVARYQAIDYLRRCQQELVAIDIECLAIAQEDHALAQITGNEISEEMESMLSTLKPSDRELFMKLYVEEKTVSQVSKETGIKKKLFITAFLGEGTESEGISLEKRGYKNGKGHLQAAQ